MAAVIPLLLLFVVQTMLEQSVCHCSVERRLILLHPSIASGMVQLIFRRIRWVCDLSPEQCSVPLVLKAVVTV